MMDAWKMRVLEERYELNEKIEKLQTFIEKNGHDHLLEKQLFIMIEYRGVLDERIKHF